MDNYTEKANRIMTVGLLKRFLYFIPALLCAVMIFSFSSQSADDSTVVSRSVTTEILLSAGHALGLDFTEEELVSFTDCLETPVRKAAHFTEYAVLGFFLLFGFFHNGLSSRRILLLTILLVLLYAVSDELHQLLSPGRAARVLDVLIDTAGGSTGTLLYYLRHRRNFHL